MLLDTQKHPAELKDDICSPEGKYLFQCALLVNYQSILSMYSYQSPRVTRKRSHGNQTIFSHAKI